MTTVNNRRTVRSPHGESPIQDVEHGRPHAKSTMIMLERARAVIRQEAAALQALANRIDERICVLADYILSSTGIVVVCGVGKSRLVGEKISATLASTGTRSITLDPVDALHGDLGRVGPGDVILALSNSGETAELKQLARAVRHLPVILSTITGHATSSLARTADVVLDIGQAPEACALGLAPTTSTTAMVAVGDALALVLQEQRGFSREDFARLHPGGSLGRQLMRVRDVMRPLEVIPVFRQDAPLSLVLLSICSGDSRQLGAAAIIGDRRNVMGILHREDIGRLVERDATPDLNDPVERHIRPGLTTISWHASLDEALRLLRQHDIELMPVHDDLERLVGLVCRKDVVSDDSSW